MANVAQSDGLGGARAAYHLRWKFQTRGRNVDLGGGVENERTGQQQSKCRCELGPAYLRPPYMTSLLELAGQE